MVTNRKLADLGSAVDSAATGNFLTVDDSGGKFRSIAYSEIASRPTVLDSAAAQAIIDSSYIQARQTDVGLDSSQVTGLVDSSYITARQSATGLDSAGALNLVDSAYLSARSTSGLDSSKVTNLIDSDYISGKAAVNSGFKTFTYFASDGQTDFSGSDYNGEVLSYTADGIIVWLNGVQILDTDDYTASNGTSVALTAGADSGASLVVGSWSLGSSGGGGTPYTGTRGFTIGGDPNAPGNGHKDIQYWDLTTTGNAASFGDILGDITTTNRPASGGNGTRVLIHEGTSNINTTQVCYITCATTGDAADFGDTIDEMYGQVGLSNGTILCLAAGYGSRTGGTNAELDNFEYFTIATTGNSTLGGGTLAEKHAADHELTGIHGATYGMIAGGRVTGSYTNSDQITRMTIATTTTSIDFGNLTGIRRYHTGGFNSTRALWAGGTTPGNSYGLGYTNVIEYVTIDTPGNGADFGDLVAGNRFMVGSCDVDNNRAAFSGGYDGSSMQNRIQYVDVSTTGNATDAGDLAYAAMGSGMSGASGNAA